MFVTINLSASEIMGIGGDFIPIHLLNQHDP